MTIKQIESLNKFLNSCTLWEILYALLYQFLDTSAENQSNQKSRSQFITITNPMAFANTHKIFTTWPKFFYWERLVLHNRPKGQFFLYLITFLKFSWLSSWSQIGMKIYNQAQTKRWKQRSTWKLKLRGSSISPDMIIIGPQRNVNLSETKRKINK